MRNRLLAAAAGIAAAAAIALAPAAAADAHDYLVSSDPAAGATVTTPLPAVTLTFNDRVLDLSGNGSTNLLTVTGPGSATRHFETGCATIADTKLTAPVALGAAGTYTVTYQVVSADGHTVSSSYAFAYQPPAGTSAAQGSEASPCGAKASASAPASPGATTSTGASSAPPGASASTAEPTTPASTGTDLGLVIGIAIGIVLLAVIGVAIILITARRKPADAARADGHADGHEDGDGSAS